MLERDLLIGPCRGHSDVDVESSQSQCDVRFPVHAKALLDDIVATLLGQCKNILCRSGHPSESDSHKFYVTQVSSCGLMIDN